MAEKLMTLQSNPLGAFSKVAVALNRFFGEDSDIILNSSYRVSLVSCLIINYIANI